MVHSDSWLVSQPIEFPLVLEGAAQAFQVGPYHTKYIVDLNRDNRDSVVFACMDSLAAAIMDDLAAHDPLWRHNQMGGAGNIQLFVSPAYNTLTGKTTDRLVFWYRSSLSYPWVYPVNENEVLLEKIGFPLWLTEQGGVVIHSIYRVDSLWYEKYSNIEVSP